ncbi:MAG: hypothetical protein LBI28_10015 [Treponema sp.]|jgi:heptaprenyl diphosphate synthase|nr:hypothetical protein [Treponema sp.]
MRRREVYENIFSARALFLAGLIIMPALLFNPSTEYRVIQFLFFLFLALLSGKRIDFLLTIFIIIFIVAFNLIIPYGRVLFSIGAFKVTSGALLAGIHRAITLSALVMLSKVTVRQDLKFPGSFGQILGESLRMFSIIINRKYRITGKNLISEIDNMMLELSEETVSQPQVNEVKTKPLGVIVLIAVIVLSWLPWFYIFLVQPK